MTYMGRYAGDDISRVNVSEIEFFKIAEEGLLEDKVTWATNVLTANDNVTAVTIPHDILPGSYLVRHELITLHFATEDSRYMDAAAKAKGAQVRLQTRIGFWSEELTGRAALHIVLQRQGDRPRHRDAHRSPLPWRIQASGSGTVL
jgi:hypothetical protein